MDDRTPSLQARALLAPVQRAAMLQFMSLLPLAAADVEAVVARAVEENPVLDRGTGWTCGTCGRFCRTPRCQACSVSSRPADLTATVDWREELRRQARLEVSADLFGLLDRVVGSLDERGFLPEQPDSGPAAVAVLSAIREVGPPGIAASSPTDCVRLQVDDLVARGLAGPLVSTIVADWLPCVADGRLVDIATALAVTEDEVRAAVEVLTSSTRPFVSLASAAPRAGPVDVDFSIRDSELVATVVDADGLGLRVADDFGQLDGDARAWLAPHREAAARLVAAVDARARMLTLVAQVLAVRQGAWLIEGRHHRSLRRAEVASELGVHPSTVGRAVSAKVARCPDGRVVPLERCFGSAPSTLERVADVITEAPTATDAVVAAELSRLGTPLARRTVAKYRALLRERGTNTASRPS